MSAPLRVVVVRTGSANLASVLAGLRRAGAVPVLGCGAHDIERAERLVLPGVGSFGAVMAQLRDEGVESALRDRLFDGRPTLAICLGLQILADASEESPGVRGLGVIPAVVRRFTGGLRVPHLGWNRVRAMHGSGPAVPEGDAYFANSYRLTDAPPGWDASVCDYGGPFVAALRRGGVLACQFHPELSGAWGLGVLRGWLAWAGASSAGESERAGDAMKTAGGASC